VNARLPTPTALILTACLAAAPAPAPTSQPAAADLVAIGNNFALFVAPPSPPWNVRQTPNASLDVVYFQNANADGAIQFILAKPDFQIEPETAGQFAAAIVKTLKEKRQQDGNEVVMPATIEHDHRFDIVIHEKFKVGDATEDELHLYKSVGPRTVMVTASCVSPDPAVVADTFTAAKASLASAKFNKKAAVHRKP